ncbi:MAG: hypothetical protein J0L70_06285 [Leptolyngbya sp. UWPOB_LEPTO1]|uniref:hypothetical protein n=1 Tax=Leptolyngbya sp. UWPOB_LEPTO1 TaxID=2815653 RepID=UPI001ACE8ADA|nr:hypothetical protein [Leptolyngbya sp. UWPOB_LEPTO1]MBN8560112.1 hypothetical protein [Leptolyngbya sp. UWPOB_LEPTO1]
MRRLTLPNQRCQWMCRFWGRGLALNRWCLEQSWFSFDLALKIQSRLLDLVAHEHKLACEAHLQVLETSFLIGELAATPEALEYFYDLRSLYHEGRFDTLLIQLYQLESRPDSEQNHNAGISLDKE